MAASVALITGASGGIGLEFATQLAQAGYDLAVVARSKDKLESIAADLRSRFGIAVQVVACDLSRHNSAHDVLAQVPECDVLVNNAGFANNGKFAQLDEGATLEEIQVDVTTLTQLTRLYLPGMLERKSGRILNVASTAGFLPGPNMAVYYASKAYVISFSEALAEEVRGSGVTVTVLCPGATYTGFAERAGATTTALFKLPMAKAADVAKAGIDGMLRGKPVVVPGITNKLVALSPKITPRRLLVAISGKAVEPGY
ncbi:MAG TPA: SDR family oxidoreductase [Candidatus Baltobacteraceae bacterium]|jgi:short-subunit dehydrogenase|nr:SDR family oxidoreductase [Candidatus Baltobacteraceae bacterium]